MTYSYSDLMGVFSSEDSVMEAALKYFDEETGKGYVFWEVWDLDKLASDYLLDREF